jgi:hypothetical protein
MVKQTTLFISTAPGFYNTTNLKEDALKQKKIKANSLNHEVLRIVSFNTMIEFTAWELYDKIQGSRPITSVRRSISDLVEMNYLEYTGSNRVSGPYKEECKLVRLHAGYKK